MAQTLRPLAREEIITYTGRGHTCGQKLPKAFIDLEKLCTKELAWLYEDGAGSRYYNWEIWCDEQLPKKCRD